MSQSPAAPRSVCLSVVAALVLTAASGCCPDTEEIVFTDREGMVSYVELERIRVHNDTPQDRCEAACLYLEEDGAPIQEIESCEAEVADASSDTEDPWDTSVIAITVRCTTSHTMGAFCTGRRPQGHHEVDVLGGSRGAWLAAHAHLERASIVAFEELAGWLERQGAPAALVTRCRAAAADEIRHADRMAALAVREGVEPPVPRADAPAEDRLAVALHNAVEGCVHEAFAAIVAAHQAGVVEEPELVDTFGEIARDELRHGQLAWDLHQWLIEGLTPRGRARVEAAQRRALAELPRVAEGNARATPEGLGWPAPEVAVAMARRFAALVQAPGLAA